MRPEHTRLVTLPSCGHWAENSPRELVGNTLPPSSHRRPTTSNLGVMHSPSSARLRTTASGKSWGGRLRSPPFSGQGFLQVSSSWSSPAEESSGGTAPQVLKATQKTFMECLRGHCHCALLLPPPNSPVGLMFLHCYDPVLCPPNSYDAASPSVLQEGTGFGDGL